MSSSRLLLQQSRMKMSGREIFVKGCRDASCALMHFCSICHRARYRHVLREQPVVRLHRPSVRVEDRHLCRMAHM